jgi:AAA domain
MAAMLPWCRMSHVPRLDAHGFCAVCQRHESEHGDTGYTHPASVSPPDTDADLRERADGYSGDTGYTRIRQKTSWTAAELMATDFPEPRWAVPGIVAEGVTVLAGAPKVGKSWLALGLGVATASGGRVLGAIDVDPGPALYLALEDTGRRLKTRLAKVLGPDRAPDTLTLATVCPPLPLGGADLISGWITRHDGARLVVVDVLARVRGPASRELSHYDADYRAVMLAKEVADKHGVAIVLVHHTRKMSAADFLDEVSGTQGVAGAADSVLVLRRMRGQADAVLNVTGRDIEEASLALTFAADIGAWQLSGTPADEIMLGDTRVAILRWVRENEGHGPTAIAEGTGMPHNTVKVTVRRMADDGQLDTDGRGHYFAPVTNVTAVTFPGQDASEPVTALSPLSLDDDQDGEQ